ncbi:hypothetical protein BDR22DRAFT_895127 [Usnea florida]
MAHPFTAELLKTFVYPGALTVLGIVGNNWYLGPRFEKIDENFKKIDGKFEKIDGKFEGIEEKLGGKMFKETGDKLEANINEMNTSIQGLNTARGELRDYVGTRIPKLVMGCGIPQKPSGHRS